MREARSSVDLSGFSPGALKALKEAGITTLAELCSLSEAEFWNIPGVGVTAMKQLERVLIDSNAKLRVDEPARLVEPFYEALQRSYAELGDFARLGERYGISRQAAYELYTWSRSAAEDCRRQREAYVEWRKWKLNRNDTDQQRSGT